MLALEILEVYFFHIKELLFLSELHLELKTENSKAHL